MCPAENLCDPILNTNCMDESWHVLSLGNRYTANLLRICTKNHGFPSHDPTTLVPPVEQIQKSRPATPRLRFSWDNSDLDTVWHATGSVNVGSDNDIPSSFLFCFSVVNYRSDLTLCNPMSAVEPYWIFASYVGHPSAIVPHVLVHAAQSCRDGLDGRLRSGPQHSRQLYAPRWRGRSLEYTWLASCAFGTTVWE